MKQIIEGKMYDTDTAELLFNVGNLGLYKTKKGALLQVVGNEMDLVSEERTKEYLGKYHILEYIKLFGEVEEG
jgi:hypothetical protein